MKADTILFVASDLDASSNSNLERLRRVATGAHIVATTPDNASGEGAVDLAVVDLSSAAGTVAILRQQFPSLPVIMLCGDLAGPDALAAFRDGASRGVSGTPDDAPLRAVLDSEQPAAAAEGVIAFSLFLPTATEIVSPTVKLSSVLLSDFASTHEGLRIGLALDEIVRNAIEHGNCGITSSEKTDLCETGDLESEVRQRAAQARADGKTIRVDFEFSLNEFRCCVHDAGPGFDWRSIDLSSQPEPSPEEIALHGRGMRYILAVFDAVEFNDSGNQITVTRRFAT